MLNGKSVPAIALAIAALFLGAPSSAWAADKTACVDAYRKAQNLRDAHQLTAAREQLRICARPTCTDFIANDCTAWLADLESRLPSIVLAMKDARGGDVVDATVTMDGAVIATKLDGRSIDVDPGQHAFRFSTAGGAPVEQTVVVLEGQKAQRVSVALPGVATAGSSGPAGSAAAVGSSAESASGSPGATPGAGASVETALPPETVGSSWSGRKTLAVVVGGVGLAGVGVGTFFGLSAMASWSSAQNECPDAHCAQREQSKSDHDSAATSATISTIAFAAGGALVAGGVVLYLIAPKHPEQATALAVTPTAGPGAAGLALRGTF